MVFASDTETAAQDDYATIFARRGREYNQSMLAYPLARAREFTTGITALAPETGETIIDAPAGGGYLQHFLPQDLEIRLVEVDPAIEFRSDEKPELSGAARSEVLIAPLDAIPLEDGLGDGIISIAGLHHTSNLTEVFLEFRRVLKASGRLVIMEVDSGSPVDGFLNGFVNRYCSEGHVGAFVGKAFRASLAAAGFQIQRDEMVPYTWDFPDRSAMVEFARLIFGLDLADSDTIQNGIGETVGFAENHSGCHMNWGLRLLVCCPTLR